MIATQQFVNRTLMLSDYVDGDSVKDLIHKIISYNMYDDHMEQMIHGYQRPAIVLIVNSFGGSVYDGFGLVSAIDMSATPVYTVALGSCMSMGFIIFAAGHVRLIHELSTLMYHEVSNMPYGKLTEIKESIYEMERLQMQYDMYIIQRSKITESVLDTVKQKKEDWYIDAHDAVKFGIADNLIEVGQQVTWDNPQ